MNIDEIRQQLHEEIEQDKVLLNESTNQLFLQFSSGEMEKEVVKGLMAEYLQAKADAMLEMKDKILNSEV